MRLPVLYTFRRCPYAIRARLAIAVSGVEVEKIEIELKNKPLEMLEISPKGTVPVLKLPDGKILDESLYIMYWALSINDPGNWLKPMNIEGHKDLIAINDSHFKYFLDRYKYADRYPEHDIIFYRGKAEEFISLLDENLRKNRFLTGEGESLVDMAIFPFIRQFAHVDKGWFYNSPYINVIRWLDALIESDIFKQVMQK
jgi:glutathione S-transferase